MASESIAHSAHWAGNLKQILCCDWLPKRTRWSHLPAWDFLHWSHRQSALFVAITWPQKEHLCSLKMAEFQSIKWLVHDNCTKWIRAVKLHHKEHDNDPYPLNKNTINYFLCIYRQAVDYGIWICTGSYRGLWGQWVNMLIFFDLL